MGRPFVYIVRMLRVTHLSRAVTLAVTLAAAILLASAKAGAQDARCAVPDTVLIVGNKRVTESTIVSDLGFEPGVALSARAVQLALKQLYASGQFDDVSVTCRVSESGQRAALTVSVRERAILGDIAVTGPKRISVATVRDQVELLIGRPVDPALVARAIARMDSVYQAEGYFLARIKVDTTPGVNDRIKVTFRVDEGRRLAISGVRFSGNKGVQTDLLSAEMKSKPEGFWWWQKGEFNEEAWAADLADRLPKFYANRGFVDMQVSKDTVRIDRERGKAYLEVVLDEGKAYRVGRLSVEGNARFSTPEIMKFYPFADETPTLTDRVSALLGNAKPKGRFDRDKWEEATTKLRSAYGNEGYIYATVRPALERRVGPDSVPVVDLRWAIDERTPAVINRIDIVGNDYTQEPCIRDQLNLVPGDVFNQERLIRSYQNISNLGFFEQPLAFPDTRQANDQGDVDVIFRVKEKKTGNINFGASVGQAIGVGGFIGLEQPNLFGQCKRGSLNWQFGSFINDFNLSYTDPAIRLSRVSGTLTAYRSQNRYQIADLGSFTRVGGSAQLGFPVPGSYSTRLFVSYGAEVQSFGSGGLTSQLQSTCNNCFRSTAGVTLQRDTRIDQPFPSAGGLQTISAQFSGGILGGTASFQRYTTELKAYAPIFQVGGERPGESPIKFLIGLTAKGGAVFGDPGAFFISQSFALGGVQFGENLRGYPEFSITPAGYISNTSTFSAQRASFGQAFMTTTVELGVRFNQQFYFNLFHDAGNVWRRPADFDPTRLFRGAGAGMTIISPLGPLGLDYAYGFDRRDALGRPDAQWQFHFRLGQQF